MYQLLVFYSRSMKAIGPFETLEAAQSAAFPDGTGTRNLPPPEVDFWDKTWRKDPEDERWYNGDGDNGDIYRVIKKIPRTKAL